MIRNLLASNLFKNVVDIGATVIVGRMLLVAVLLVGMFGVSVYNGIDTRNKVAESFNLQEMHYIVHGRSCKFIFNGDTLDVVSERVSTPLSANMHKCPPKDASFLEQITSEHEGATRAVHKKDVYFTYVIGFVLFVLASLMSLGNAHTPNISNNMNLYSITFGWLLVSVLLFPMTYRDYGMGARHEYNDNEYYVTSAILSNDGSRYITTSESFLSMNNDLKTNFAKPLNSL